jgi:hypothetical protein
VAVTPRRGQREGKCFGFENAPRQQEHGAGAPINQVNPQPWLFPPKPSIHHISAWAGLKGRKKISQMPPKGLDTLFGFGYQPHLLADFFPKSGTADGRFETVKRRCVSHCRGQRLIT